jgi:hypothetical protein
MRTTVCQSPLDLPCKWNKEEPIPHRNYQLWVPKDFSDLRDTELDKDSVRSYNSKDNEGNPIGKTVGDSMLWPVYEGLMLVDVNFEAHIVGPYVNPETGLASWSGPFHITVTTGMPQPKPVWRSESTHVWSLMPDTECGGELHLDKNYWCQLVDRSIHEHLKACLANSKIAFDSALNDYVDSRNMLSTYNSPVLQK